MNTPRTGSDLLPHKEYSQVKGLFESLNLSNQDKENIKSEFYSIAKTIYENSGWISNDTIMKIKLWETNPDSFIIQSDYEWDIIAKYLNFIQSYPNWEKIWRTLSAYYNPNQY